MSRHVYHLKQTDAYYQSGLGSLQRCNKDQLPILKNLSMKRLILEPKAIREPHWIANANELTYCLSGHCLVSVLDSGSEFGTFTISAGQMFHIKSGSLHYIENLSDTESAEFIHCVRHEKPEDFSFGAAIGAMTPAVLGNAWNLQSSAFSKIKLSTKDKHIVEREGAPTVTEGASLPNHHKYDVEAQEPVIKPLKAGENRPARSQFWPDLQNMSMYSLVIEDTGMREPHWHPITAEMGYVQRGKARMTIMDPDGSLDTYILNEGDMYFIPAAYPHQIEVLESPDIHFLIFFDQPMPGDIGYKTSATAVQHEVMAATLGISRKDLPNIEGIGNDPLLVKRVNAVDPVETNGVHG